MAQRPVEPRDSSRLFILHRLNGGYEHKQFFDIDDYLKAGDLLVVNRSRVVPARLHGKKVPSGGRVEILLLEKVDLLRWKALVGGKRLKTGTNIQIKEGVTAEIADDLGGAQREIVFSSPVEEMLSVVGQMPLPPYITEPLKDAERYQTVYSKELGSAAAPTAGLHFTPHLIEGLKEKEVDFAEVLLHVGLDTFAPVSEIDPGEHKIHSEWCRLSPETAEAINACWERGGRIVAVGTTTVRVLETAARVASGREIRSFEGRTKLFILPGYEFKIVDAMITNFHLPRSTLLMLVCAFAGRETILHAYRKAIDMNYRFYSFGDAMLIL
ncbi:MAG: tRNA preQ1(34) S-adenosylmethionine ribosyltransferase-isomerase QueA [Anaerolineales bacterium]